MTAPPWTPEQVVEPELAAALIAQQFPALQPAHLEPIGDGWDNTAYRVNDKHVFRFPRRAVAVPGVEAEARITPLLAPALPCAISETQFVGTPTDAFPWPFIGTRFVPGDSAHRHQLHDSARGALAAPLGAFLRALHHHDADAGADTIERDNVAVRRPRAMQRLDELPIDLIEYGVDPAAVRAVIETDPTPAHPDERRVVHGDLDARHLHLTSDYTLAGIIDWGDVHRGDAALDLSLVISFLPASAHAAFLKAYGPIDDATWSRARFRAVCHSVLFVGYGHEIGDANLVTEAVGALRRVIEFQTP